MYRKQFRRFRNDCKNAQNFTVYLENVSRVLFMSTTVPEKVVLIPDAGTIDQLLTGFTIILSADIPEFITLLRGPVVQIHKMEAPITLLYGKWNAQLPCKMFASIRFHIICIHILYNLTLDFVTRVLLWFIPTLVLGCQRHVFLLLSFLRATKRFGNYRRC